MNLTTNPENAIKIEAMTAIFRSLSIGEIASYSRILEAAQAKSVQSVYWLIKRAIADAEADGTAKFAAVRAEGIKRLAIDEYSGIGAAARKTIGVKAKAAFKRLSNVTANEVSPDVRTRINAERSLLGAVAAISQTSTMKKVEQHTQTSPMVAENIFQHLSKGA